MSKNSNENTVTTPAYVVLCNSISEALAVAGIELKEQETVIDGVGGNANWACFERLDSGHKLYVQRSPGKGVVHTTVEVDPTLPGYIDPRGKAPGKISAYFEADMEKVTRHLVPLFVAASEPLRANRMPVRKAKDTAAPAINDKA